MKKRLITASLLTAMLMIGGTVMADDDDSNGSLELRKAEWNAQRQRLEVSVRTDDKNDSVTVRYDGQNFQMRSREEGRFYLREGIICYDDSLSIMTSSGLKTSSSVKVTNGTAEGHYCNNADSGGDDDGDEGDNTGTADRDVVVFASNDLGMHCACPGTEYFMLLPPFNTLRAQVIERGEHPKTLTAADGITVKYRMVENTDESLKNDPYYATWLENMPKYGFGPGVRADGKIQGVSGATLDGAMDSQKEGWWEVVGVPAFPDLSVSTDQERVMHDPLGGPNRNPYPTAKIEVYDTASGQKLAETSTVVPVAFGGCCNCHLQVTKDKGLAPTEANSFILMGQMHERDSGINFAKMDPDGDGTPGPIRCSACHLDPAMGETVAPGYPGLPTSKYTFSNVLHRWHVENPAVLSYNPNLATDCYACHPGNNVGCFRGVHADKGMWCTDCHGDLNQRVAEGQVDNPWSSETLPKCNDCHQGTEEGGGFLNIFGGEFLNSMGHKDNKVLCSSCHGSPHSLYPSTMAKDNVQPMALQGSESAIGKCSVCHTNEADAWSVPAHGDAIPSLKEGSTGGGTTVIDAAQELQTTCLNCHRDRSNSVDCNNSKWMSHDGSKVSSAVFAAVSTNLTGGDCQVSSGGGSTGGGTTVIDAAQELQTTCLNCHGDRSNSVDCNNSKWMSHDGSKVSSAVFAAVSTNLTGGDCQVSSGGGSTGGGTTVIDAAQELQTTCLNCHGDKSNSVDCNNSKWMSHDGSRVSNEVFAAVSNHLTGGDCQASSVGGDNSGIDPAQELRTTCLNCHGDKSGEVECGKDDWLEHRVKRVSDAVFQAVDTYLNGNCAAKEEDD